MLCVVVILLYVIQFSRKMKVKKGKELQSPQLNIFLFSFFSHTASFIVFLFLKKFCTKRNDLLNANKLHFLERAKEGSNSHVF